MTTTPTTYAADGHDADRAIDSIRDALTTLIWWGADDAELESIAVGIYHDSVGGRDADVRSAAGDAALGVIAGYLSTILAEMPRKRAA